MTETERLRRRNSETWEKDMRLRDSEGDRRDKELAVYGKRETHTDRH